MDEDERRLKIGQLDAKRMRGQRAASELRAIEPALQDLRDLYVEQLIKNTKADAKVDEFTVYLLVAQERLLADLKEKMRHGASADKKIKALTSGGSE